MRVGFNPNKDLKIKSNYYHRIIVPVCVPNLEGYFKDGLEITTVCLESLIKTMHSQSALTVINNGSCAQVTNYLQDLYKAGKIDQLIHHKQNLGKIDQCALNEDELLKIPIEFENHMRYGFLGRLSDEKGIIPLIQYFKKSNKKLIIAGSGPLKTLVLKEIQNTQISYVGLIKQTNISHFFEKIDVLLIPSLEETGPLVGVEAMAAGKIILSTKVGAVPERLQEMKNAIWLPSLKTESIGKAIEELENLSNLERINYANEIRAIYLEKYNNKKIAFLYNNLISQILT